MIQPFLWPSCFHQGNGWIVTNKIVAILIAIIIRSYTHTHTHTHTYTHTPHYFPKLLGSSTILVTWLKTIYIFILSLRHELYCHRSFFRDLLVCFSKGSLLTQSGLCTQTLDYVIPRFNKQKKRQMKNNLSLNYFYLQVTQNNTTVAKTVQSSVSWISQGSRLLPIHYFVLIV